MRRGLPFVIVDRNERVGDAWRNRWVSRLCSATRVTTTTLDNLPHRNLLPSAFVFVTPFAHPTRPTTPGRGPVPPGFSF